jgi:hypothetical protein
VSSQWLTVADESAYGMVVGILGIVGGWVISRRKRNNATDDARLARLEELERQVATIKQAVTPISVAMQDLLVRALTHFHTPRIDLLLTKLGPPVSLTVDEEVELAYALKQRAGDMGPAIPELERGAAMMLPYIVQRVRVEAAAPVDLSKTDVRVVAVPKGDDAP